MFQTQTQMQHNVEVQQMKYMIFQDMENVFNVAAQFNAVLDSCDPNDPLVTIFYNRLIIQLNISNMVHLDFQDRMSGSTLEAFKTRAREITYKVEEKITNPFIRSLLENYNNNLDKQVHLRNLQQRQLNIQSQFDAKVAQDVINNIASFDQTMSLIAQQELVHQEKNSDQIFDNYIQQYQNGLNKLRKY